MARKGDDAFDRMMRDNFASVTAYARSATSHRMVADEAVRRRSFVHGGTGPPSETNPVQFRGSLQFVAESLLTWCARRKSPNNCPAISLHTETSSPKQRLMISLRIFRFHNVKCSFCVQYSGSTTTAQLRRSTFLLELFGHDLHVHANLSVSNTKTHKLCNCGLLNCS